MSTHRFRRFTDVTKSIGPRPAVCKFDGCDNPANIPGTGRGFCKKHYTRLYVHGDPSITLIQVGNDPVCTVDGCQGAHRSRGMCMSHYNQWAIVQARLSGVRCEVEGCPKPVRCKGLCAAHYSRKRKFGDVQSHLPIRNDLPGDVSWCPDCQSVKPKTDFVKCASRPDGTAVYCKECWTVRVRTLYREKTYASQKAWRTANPEKVAEYLRRYAEANPEKMRAKLARQKAAKPEQYRLYGITGDHNRRARERDAPGFATTAQVVARLAYFGGNCWMCGEVAVEVDHVKPLAKGGSQWPSNLRPACRRCNSRKRARWPYPLEVTRGPRPASRQAA